MIFSLLTYFQQMPLVEWRPMGERKVGEAAGPPCRCPSFSGAAVLFPSHLSPQMPCYGTHLGLSSSTIHSQSDREGTANDVDFKEGAKEVAAAQGDHLLWGQGQDWRWGLWGAGSR